MINRFLDRTQAGRAIANQLISFADKPQLVVLALPRGGVEVGYEVAKALNAPLDIFLVRKLGIPGQEEFAMGAIAENGVQILNKQIINTLGISENSVQAVAERETRELERRKQLYRGHHLAPGLHNCIVILVDDGIATGSTMKAAIYAIRQQLPKMIVVAVPVASAEAIEEIKPLADKVISLIIPRDFYSVGAWYQNFSEVSDSDVIRFLKQTKLIQDTLT